MLNQKIEDHSRKGVVLFFCVLVLGIVLRVFSLGGSATILEVDQLFYSRHLDQVFFNDSQTPVHYLFSPLSGSVTSIRVIFIVMNLMLVLMSSYLLMVKKSMSSGLMLFVSWWLWPLNVMRFDLVPSVMLLILVWWHSKVSLKPWCEWVCLAFIQLFVPLSFLLIWVLNIKTGPMRLKFILSTTLPVSVYYVSKFGVFGFTNFSFPVPDLQFLIFLLPLSYLVFQKTSVKSEAIYGLLVVFLLYHGLILKPWNHHPGDDQAVASFKAYTAELYERPVIICATIPQQDYYFKQKQNCQNHVLKHQLEKTDFYFFDLSGSRQDLAAFLKKNAPHVEEKNFRHARFLSVSY